MSEQYPLAIALSQTATLATWVPGDNGALMHQLYALLDGRERHSLTVYGPEGAGKSHLLQACCQAVFERNGKALYFSLDEFKHQSPGVLVGLETLDLVCIDDLDVICGQSDWEEALFHLYNRCLYAECRLIFACESSLQALPMSLPDLQSRLTWNGVYELQALNDEGLAEAIEKRAMAYRIELSKGVAALIVEMAHQHERDVFEVFEALDHASLAHKRNKLTKPFVQSFFKD